MRVMEEGGYQCKRLEITNRRTLEAFPVSGDFEEGRIPIYVGDMRYVSHSVEQVRRGAARGCV